jgi:hypothetical protein
VKKQTRQDQIGTVVGESGRTFTVRLTKRQRIVVVAGTGLEWRWPLADYDGLTPDNSMLFQRVRALLDSHGCLA